MEPSPSLLRRAVAWAQSAGAPAQAESEGSQFGEERLLQEIFGDRTHGDCAEIGAFDGLINSATLEFERRGWNCLLVEPNQEMVEAIRANRSGAVVAAAASSEDGEATFYVAENVAQMSTLALSSEHDAWVRGEGGQLRATTVRTARLDTLLEEAGFERLDFLTIDVEGHELEVLAGFTLERFAPRVVILEENTPQWRSPVSRHMAAHRYVSFRRTGVNEWYARDDDHGLIDPAAVRRFRVEKQLLRAVGVAAAAAARYTPDTLKRLLYRLRDRITGGGVS